MSLICKFIFIFVFISSAAFAQGNYLSYRVKEGENFRIILKKFKITPVDGNNGKLYEMQQLNKETIDRYNYRLPVGTKVILPVNQIQPSNEYTVNNFGEIVQVNQNITTNNINVGNQQTVANVSAPTDKIIIGTQATGNKPFMMVRVPKTADLAQRLERMGIRPTWTGDDYAQNVTLIVPYEYINAGYVGNDPTLRAALIQKGPEMAQENYVANDENDFYRYQESLSYPRKIMRVETEKDDGPVGFYFGPTFVYNTLNSTASGGQATRLNSNLGSGANLLMNIKLSKVFALRPYFNYYYLLYKTPSSFPFSDKHRHMLALGLDGRFQIGKYVALSLLLGSDQLNLVTKSATSLYVHKKASFVYGGKMAFAFYNKNSNATGVELGIKGWNRIKVDDFKTNPAYSLSGLIYTQYFFYENWGFKLDFGTEFVHLRVPNRYTQHYYVNKFNAGLIWNIKGI